MAATVAATEFKRREAERRADATRHGLCFWTLEFAHRLTLMSQKTEAMLSHEFQLRLSQNTTETHEMVKAIYDALARDLEVLESAVTEVRGALIKTLADRPPPTPAPPAAGAGAGAGGRRPRGMTQVEEEGTEEAEKNDAPA